MRRVEIFSFYIKAPNKVVRKYLLDLPDRMVLTKYKISNCLKTEEKLQKSSIALSANIRFGKVGASANI